MSNCLDDPGKGWDRCALLFQARRAFYPKLPGEVVMFACMNSKQCQLPV